MKYPKQYILIVLVMLFISSCDEKITNNTAASEAEKPTDPLPSWNEGATKAAIMTFVQDATNEQSPSFIPVADRIATFDNDGNLWAEQPMYFQLFFAIDRVKELAPEHPEWATEQPFQAVLENDMETLIQSGERGLLQLVMASHAGVTTDEFETIVAEWLATSRHPKYDKPFNELIYQPMLELLQYLRANDFKTFIVSGGGVEFMRVWVEEAYGIPKDQVVGSSIKTEFDYNDGDPVIRRLPEIDFIDDKGGKPVGISKFIGRRPVLASGNSDGDLQMIQYATGGNGLRLGLYLHHTDAEREFAYDRESHIGRLDKGLDEAAANGWTVIDMAKDWKVVFPFELAK
ncbi:MAG: HAD family hydrolase [Cyclobacteriaceae bacterium]